MASVKSEDRKAYGNPTESNDRLIAENSIIAEALNILESRTLRCSAEFSQPDHIKDFLRLRLGALEHEIFACLFLDNRHRMISFKELFRGTVDGASVHPREVVKESLFANAAAVVFVHNHPSGRAEPSEADRRITQKLIDALKLVDIRTLDHFVIGGTEIVSFAERGLM